MNQSNFIQNLNKKSNFHNIDFISQQYSSHINRILSFGMFEREHFQKIFENNIKDTVNQDSLTLRKCCKLKDYHLNLQQLFLSKMEEKAEQYLINNPTDKKFKESWELFRVAAARLLYGIDPNILPKAHKYFEEVQEKLRLIDHSLPKSLQENEVRLQKVFIDIIKRQIGLIEVPISLLAGIGSRDTLGKFHLKTTSTVLFEANNFFIKKLQQNLPWLFNYCENKLSPFLKSSNEELKKLTEQLLDIVKHCKESFLPRLFKLTLTENDNGACKDKMRVADSLNDSILKYIFNKDNWESISAISDDEEFDSRWATSKIIKESWKACRFFRSFNIVRLSYNPLEESLESLRKKKENVSEQPDHTLQDVNNAINTIEEINNFRDVFQECTELMAIYFKYPFAELYEINSHLIKWLSDDKVQREINLNINKITEQIEGKKKNTQKAKKAKPRKKKKPQPTQFSPKKTEIEQKPISIQSPSTTWVDNPEQVSQALANIVRQDHFESSREKNAYRQAHMYLEDLIVATQEVQCTPIESVKLFYSNAIVQSAYLFLEQMMQSQIKSSKINGDDKPGHNLIALLKRLDHVSPSQSFKNLVKELSVAYLWTRCTYEQIERRNDIGMEIPLCLRSIQQIYDTEVFSGKKIDQQVNKILPYCKRVSDLIRDLPVVSVWKKPLNHLEIEPKKFDHQANVNPNKYQELIVNCKTLLGRMPPYLQPVFKQAICHMELVNGCLHELNKKSCSPRAFSLLVRSLLFWENTLLEEFLRTLYGLKSGVNSISHKVNKLYDLSIPNYDKKREDIEFLTTNFANVHNISRYPFSINKGSQLTRDLILKTEILRECNELGSEEKEFELEGNKTSLNYLPLRDKHLNSKEMMARLVEISNGISTLISQKIVPEIYHQLN